MRPLSAFNASASALGNVHANWTVRSIGTDSFPTVSTDGFFLWPTNPENGMKPGTRNPPYHVGWKPPWLAAGYDSVNGIGDFIVCDPEHGAPAKGHYFPVLIRPILLLFP